MPDQPSWLIIQSTMCLGNASLETMSGIISIKIDESCLFLQSIANERAKQKIETTLVRFEHYMRHQKRRTINVYKNPFRDYPLLENHGNTIQKLSPTVLQVKNKKIYFGNFTERD